MSAGYSYAVYGFRVHPSAAIGPHIAVPGFYLLFLQHHFNSATTYLVLDDIKCKVDQHICEFVPNLISQFPQKMKSITFYLTLLVIRLKGIKGIFSEDPIDYKKLRKEDVHQPDAKNFRPHLLKQFTVMDSLLTELKPVSTNGFLLIFCHGGAFVYGPVQHHWDAAKQIVTATQCTLWMVDYPKAPEHKIDTISHNLDAVYTIALEHFGAEKIIVIGDSVGATLLTSLTQRLIRNHKALPSLLILISPVMDATMANPEIDLLDKLDPLLSKAGVLSAKKMCALDGRLEDPRISPIQGDFKCFPPTMLLLAEHDITYPDQQLVVQQMATAGVKTSIIFGAGMPHIWTILPVMAEGKAALGKIINSIREITLNQ